MPRTTAKVLPADANYLLRVELLTRWKVVRFISVPHSITFHDLHSIIQIAFEWGNCHLYRFEILDGPPITKSKRPAYSESLPTLLLLNAYAKDDEWEEFRSSTIAVLGELLEHDRYMKKRIRYTYDLGFEWTHYVTVVKRVEKGEIKIVDAEGGALIEDPTESEDDEELDLDLDKLNSRLAKLQESMLSNIPKAES